MKEIIITATVLILFVLLIRRIFRGRISSRLQYALWLLVAFRLVIPVSAQIDLGPFTRFRLMDLVGQVELERGDMVERLGEPIQVTVDSQGMLYRLIGNDAQKAQMEEALGNIPADGSSVVFMVGMLRFTWLDILRLLWIAGMLAVGLWIIVSNILFSHKLKKSRRPFALSEEEKAVLLKKKDGSDIFRKKGKGSLPALYLTNYISSPCLYGFLGREAVYLTEEVAGDSDKLRHVLLHELVHKKHGDSYWAFLRSVLVTVYWFHPLVWVAAACSKRDCELACDEGVLALLGEEERIAYGETLLSIITRKSRFSDLVCTATTMTGSGKSVKERIQFIVKKPRVLYAAVAAVSLLTVFVCVFVFTQNPGFKGGIIVDSADGLTVTGADMQIRLPASIGGISGYMIEEESDDVVIYHVKTQREVGRFSRMAFRDAVELVDEGRQILPIGNQGNNYLLWAYMGDPLGRTEHTYTPADGATQGALWHEDVYLPAESIITEDYLPAENIVIDDGGPSMTMHTYTPGMPGTDSNDDDDTTYVLDDGEAEGSENPMLNKDWEVVPLEEEEVKVEYLPNEQIETTEYPAQEINIDEIPSGCYVYVKADYTGVNEKYLDEMKFIDKELRTAVGDVIILSLNRERREALFDDLTKNRTPYVGDNTKVGALLSALPIPPTLIKAEGFSLQTAEEPYSLQFKYEMCTDIYTQEDQDMVYFNAAMLFYAIGNVDEIVVEIENPSGKGSMVRSFFREDMGKNIPALQDADYENDQIFRDKLLEVHTAIEEYLSSIAE